MTPATSETSNLLRKVRSFAQRDSREDVADEKLPAGSLIDT